VHGGLNDPITHNTVISHAAVPLLIVPLKVWQGSACASTDWDHHHNGYKAFRDCLLPKSCLTKQLRRISAWLAGSVTLV